MIEPFRFSAPLAALAAPLADNDQRSSGFADGYAAGLADGAAQLSQMAEDFALALTRLEADHLARLDDIAAAAADIAVAAAQQLAASIISDAPLQAVENVMRQLLRDLPRAMPITLTVNPAQESAIAGSLARLQTQERRQFHITLGADPAVAAGDARLCWEGGGARLDAAARAAAIAAIASSFGTNKTGPAEASPAVSDQVSADQA